MNTGINVLIADTSKEFGEACKLELEKLGYNVQLCGRNGEDVIKNTTKVSFDALIMDVFMPGIDGLEVLEYFENNLTVKPIAILLSAVDSPDLEGQIMASGADYYFIKPVKPETIAARLEKLIKWRSKKGKAGAVFSTRSDDLEVVISDVMRQIGVPAHIKGYQYLRTSIELCVNNPKLLDSITKLLYPEVAKMYSTTASRVERAVRHSIEVAWSRGDVEILNSYFGYTIDANRGKPTNSEFIAMISDKIRLSMKTG